MHAIAVHFFLGLLGEVPLSAELQVLWRLQRTEQEIEAAENLIRTYPVEKERLQAQLDDLEEKKAWEKARIEELEKERRKKEGELDQEEEKIRKTQLRLMEVKTNKEYQALLKEIEWAKEVNSQREEDVIGIMDEIDQRRAELKEVETRIEDEKKDVTDKIRYADEQMVQLDHEIRRLVETRKDLIGHLGTELLDRYRVLKQRKFGSAVVLVRNEACQGCHVHIPPQLYNEVLKNSAIIQCPNCQRILYWEHEQTTA